MNTLNMCKTVMVALVASYITMVFFNNVTDYSTNLSYIQHVMTMDSLPQDSSHHWRSIQLPQLHHVAYLFIIILQLLSSALCWKGFLQFLRHTNRESVISARQTSSLGLVLAFGIWFGGFFVIGGEWFLAWQTPWGGLSSASRILIAIGVTLIFINLPDDY
ncbi:DUF2165 family protein [Endozoicomonas atrinae]|uniref:DUF2165 family protein n=1 Tax=Endozoicomonas atrinae TaxID=1333660 RepID=UPI003B00C7B1